MAQKLNADLDDYSRRRGRRGENVENYASCAWLMDCSAGLPASAVWVENLLCFVGVG